MDSNFSEMVQNVMSDSDAMSRLMEIAQGLMSGSNSDSPTELQQESDKQDSHEAVNLMSKIKSGNDERIALISALRPFLSPERRKSADNLIKMMKMMKLADMNKLLNQL
jgi:hypothetical protein